MYAGVKTTGLCRARSRGWGAIGAPWLDPAPQPPNRAAITGPPKIHPGMSPVYCRRGGGGADNWGGGVRRSGDRGGGGPGLVWCALQEVNPRFFTHFGGHPLPPHSPPPGTKGLTPPSATVTTSGVSAPRFPGDQRGHGLQSGLRSLLCMFM